MPMPAAPRPICPTTASSSRIPTWRQAAISAAIVTTAVPWTSSCITGTGNASINRRSISKHSGVEMSSRWMPPKPGAIRTTVSTNSSGSWVSIRIGVALMSTSCA
jgi:hypothetical protein